VRLCRGYGDLMVGFPAVPSRDGEAGKLRSVALDHVPGRNCD
jgi:hypothetical protein